MILGMLPESQTWTSRIWSLRCSRSEHPGSAPGGPDFGTPSRFFRPSRIFGPASRIFCKMSYKFVHLFHIWFELEGVRKVCRVRRREEAESASQNSLHSQKRHITVSKIVMENIDFCRYIVDGHNPVSCFHTRLVRNTPCVFFV